MAMLFITHDLGIVRKMARPGLRDDQGPDRRAGPTEEIFANPQHAYTRHLLAAEPKGDPPHSDPTRAGRDGGRRSEGLVSDQARLPPQDRRPHQGGRRRRRRRARRADARRGRRIGLGQDDARPRADAADLVGRADRLSRQSDRRAELQGDAAAPRRDADRLPGSLRLAQRRACRSATSSAKG